MSKVTDNPALPDNQAPKAPAKAAPKAKAEPLAIGARYDHNPAAYTKIVQITNDLETKALLAGGRVSVARGNFLAVSAQIVCELLENGTLKESDLLARIRAWKDASKAA